MKWILGSWHHDISAFYLPGCLALLLVWAIPGTSVFYTALAFLILAAIDSGHGYATAWRVFHHPMSVQAFKAIGLLILVGIVSFSWMSIGIPYFWSFVLYFTTFHHIRQFYGITRWYERLAGHENVWNSRFLYLVTIIPFIGFHFRQGTNYSLYTSQDLFLYPSARLFALAVVISSGILLSWLIFEYRQWKNRGTIETGRFLSIGIPGIFHFYCFYLGKTIPEILFPLLAVHGVTYLALISLSRKSLSGGRVNLIFSFCLVAATALIAGIWESWIEADFASFSYETMQLSALEIAAATLIVAPAIWHYIVDGFIWKIHRTDSKIIYGDRGAV